ncbi:MAG: nitroreductase family protein [Pseudomonadota bacterium]
MEKVLSAIKNRRSIRKYRAKEVSADQIRCLLESARLAPSGNNTQPWRFIVVKDKEMIQKLADLSHNQQWMTSAPVIIACIADMRSRVTDDIEVKVDENDSSNNLKKIIRDTSIAIEHIVLQAEELGLSTCWIAWFTQDEIRPLLEIPKDKYLVALLTVGYKDQDPEPRPRHEFENIVFYEKWECTK